jgi:alpha-tubulin suppressor-like RCC1 family protein
VHGELGNGFPSDPQNSPIQVDGFGRWTNFSAGYYSSLGVRGSALYSWGGRVGSSGFPNDSSPQQVGFEFDWKTVINSKASGPTLQFHALALKRTGTLWSWGYNFNGQLGNGSNTSTTDPAQVGTSTNWLAVTAGTAFSGALQRDGSMWSWGDNSFGQLGTGTCMGTNLVSQVGAETNWVTLAMGNQHALALKADGTLWAWGDNSFGQCAQPALFDPVPVAGTNWGKPRQ